MVDLIEIQAGAVVWMDPDILEEYGAFCPRWPWDRLDKVRPYLCVACDGHTATFAAMSSKPGTGRHPRLFIPPQYLIGSHKFRETEQYVCGDGNLYEGPLSALQAASEPDRGWRGNRNRIHEDFMPEVLEFIELEGWF